MSADLVSAEAFLLGLLMTIFSLSLHMALSLWMCQKIIFKRGHDRASHVVVMAVRGTHVRDVI